MPRKHESGTRHSIKMREVDDEISLLFKVGIRQFPKLVFDQLGQRIECFFAVRAFGGNLQTRAIGGLKQEKRHNVFAVHGLGTAFNQDADAALETFRQLDELC